MVVSNQMSFKSAVFQLIFMTRGFIETTQDRLRVDKIYLWKTMVLNTSGLLAFNIWEYMLKSKYSFMLCINTT